MKLIHWKDAQAYRRKYGRIDQYFFIKLRKYCKKKLENLPRAEYTKISEYGLRQLSKELFEEPFTEYRIWRILKKVL